MYITDHCSLYETISANIIQQLVDRIKIYMVKSEGKVNFDEVVTFGLTSVLIKLIRLCFCVIYMNVK